MPKLMWRATVMFVLVRTAGTIAMCEVLRAYVVAVHCMAVLCRTARMEMVATGRMMSEMLPRATAVTMSAMGKIMVLAVAVPMMAMPAMMSELTVMVPPMMVVTPMGPVRSVAVAGKLGVIRPTVAMMAVPGVVRMAVRAPMGVSEVSMMVFAVAAMLRVAVPVLAVRVLVGIGRGSILPIRRVGLLLCLLGMSLSEAGPHRLAFFLAQVGEAAAAPLS